MEVLYKCEIDAVIKILEKEFASAMEGAETANAHGCGGVARLWAIQAEMMNSVKTKLECALRNGDKRIKVVQ